MHIIKVNATDSTNSLAKEWLQSNRNTKATCIVAFEQTRGRGQRGAVWSSNAGENLTFSVIFPFPAISLSHQFLLSAGAGLAITECLNTLGKGNFKLKWPNDIMAAGFKIGGILIENILANGRIEAVIIGIGLNVNQMEFPGLPKAASLRKLWGKEIEKEMLLEKLLEKLEATITSLSDDMRENLLCRYEKDLFRRNKASTFQFPDGKLFTGIIKGVTPEGLLRVRAEGEKLRIFDLKQVKLLF